MVTPNIGRHLASLNLFREQDGSVQITVAGGTGAIAELEQAVNTYEGPPIHYIEGLIVEAARNIVDRAQPKLPTERGNSLVVHPLKVHPQFWEGVKNGTKPFEVRLNDRKFRCGEQVRLLKYDPSFGVDHSEPPVSATITYVLAHEDFPQGVPQGFVVLGFGNHPTFDDGR